MNIQNKNEHRALQQLLQTNTPPEPEATKRQALIRQLSEAAMDMDYLGQESFVERVLTIISYFSVRTWIAHIALLAVFFCCTQSRHESQLLAALFSLAPGLTVILLFELSKTFGCNMWEMEAACRYNLPQLFFMRLCALSGLDFLVLSGCLAAFRVAGGMFLQFTICTLLPFFLLSSLCLLLLRYFGSRCGLAGLVSAVILLSVLWVPFSQIFDQIRILWGDRALKNTVLSATLAVLLLYLGSAAALCSKKYYKTPERNCHYGA